MSSDMARISKVEATVAKIRKVDDQRKHAERNRDSFYGYAEKEEIETFVAATLGLLYTSPSTRDY